MFQRIFYKIAFATLICLAPVITHAQMQRPKNFTDWARVQDVFAMAAGDTVRFGKDEVFLNPNAFAAVEKQAEWLKANPAIRVIIAGHADAGEASANKKQLGETRARAVAAYLQHLGIAADRLKTGTYGADRPLQPCAEESCARDNRRVQTSIAP